MTPEALKEKLPGPWQDHKQGAAIVLGKDLSFVVTTGSDQMNLIVDDSSGSSSWPIGDVGEIPAMLGRYVANSVVHGSAVFTHGSAITTMSPDWLRSAILDSTSKLDKELREKRSKAYSLTMLMTPIRNSCNMHDDCEQANQRAREKGRLGADHCHDDCCEDCFGT